MKTKYIFVHIAIWTIPALFVGTFLVFCFRYMWFAVNVVPFERWIVAFFGALVSGMIAAVASSSVPKY